MKYNVNGFSNCCSLGNLTSVKEDLLLYCDEGVRGFKSLAKTTRLKNAIDKTGLKGYDTT